MVRTVKIYDNGNTIKLLWGSDSLEQYITKNYAISNIDLSGTNADSDYCIVHEDNGINTRIHVDDVTVPSVANLAALSAVLANFNNTATGTGSKYSTTFTNGDLAAGILSVNHALNSTAVGVFIYDPSGLSDVDPVTIVDADNLTIDFGGAIGAGNWTVVVIA